MGVGVVCPRCKISFPFCCNNCSSYQIVLFENFEPLKYFQNKNVYYFLCQECKSEYDNAICPACSKQILPEPPFVIGDKAKGSFKGCFIATACLGENSHILKQLYVFRDELLVSNFFGKLFVKYYYIYSPKLAFYISKKALLKTFSKFLIVYPVYFTSLVVMEILSANRRLKTRF